MINNEFTTIKNSMQPNLIKLSVHQINVTDFSIATLSKNSNDSDDENYDIQDSLVHVLPNNDYGEQSENIIIDLLMQLRANQDQQNSFINSRLSVREQLLDRLNAELKNSRNVFNTSQIKNIQNIVNNNTFDNRSFAQVISSISMHQKKN